MALYRSKLGPVGGAGEGGSRDGGIVIDLDPLSAFALMGGGGAEVDTSAPSSNSRGAEHGLAQGGGATQPGKEKSASPVSARPGAADTTLDLESWHMTDLTPAVPPSQPLVITEEVAGNRGYPPAPARQPAAYPMTPAHRPPVRRLSSLIATPSPPRQLRALRESSQLNNWKAGEMKTGGGGGGGGAAVGGVPSVEDGGGNEGSAEKIDPLEILRVEGIECLDGELLLVKLQNASFEGLHGKMVPGVLIMTTYKLLLIPHKLPRRGSNSNAPGPDERFASFGHLPKEYVQVPMTYIDKIERDSDRKGTQRVDRYFNADAATTIHCKDARRLRVSLGGPEESERALKMLQQLAFPGQLMEHLFAFSHRTVAAGSPDPGWHIYDPIKEFDRMGALKPRRNGASPWRATDLNFNYGLCASYPSVLVVPASVTDLEIEAVAQFRSEQRVPVLCWGRRADSGSIWRSSQPKIGISRAACAEDEMMLARIAASSPSRILPIVDCRPRSNATANFAAGYGYESYPDCPLEFSGIGNIHVMRDSLAKLEALCLGPPPKDDWTLALAKTEWLAHVRCVLSSAWTVAFKAHTQRTPVLVHCSHGWDRTSQVCSLAQMLLDPYYRTIDGFQVLIEKDWLAFGHPFHLRHAYGLPRGSTSATENQRSPIFLQFLDCAWQLVMQLPSYFEFNPRYLLCIADHIQSCRFGTFLCNNNKARRDANLEEKCGSLWTFLELHRPSFVSHLYSVDDQGELLPPLSTVLRHVRLWTDYFLRWSPAPCFLSLPLSIRDADDGGKVDGQSGGRNSPAANAEGSQTRSPPPAEKDGNAPLPSFRCEFDETERWIKLHEREAVLWRQKVLGGRDADATQGASTWSGGSIDTPEPQRPESGELAAAREEIALLKAALAEKEEILSVMMVEAGVGSPVMASRASPHAHSAPTKPSMTMLARLSDTNTARMTTTARTHSRSSGSLAVEEADYEDLEPETSSDGGDGGGEMYRPRVHSSTMESREVRRSSVGDMSADEERGRCLTGAKPDNAAERDSWEEGEARNRSRPGARADASWKWDFKGWTQAGGGGRTNANGVVMGRKARARK